MLYMKESRIRSVTLVPFPYPDSSLLQSPSVSIACISVRSANDSRFSCKERLAVGLEGKGTEPGRTQLTPVLERGSVVRPESYNHGGRTLTTEKEGERQTFSCFTNLLYNLCLRSTKLIEHDTRIMMMVVLNIALM